MIKNKYQATLWVSLLAITMLGLSAAEACTRIFWNTNKQGLLIVGRNEDYVTASDPTFVVTPRGIKRTGTETASQKTTAINWTVKYGNVAIYANNRFPNDGMNEKGLTARTLFYIDGDPNESIAPDSTKLELDADHWVSYLLDNFATVADAVEAIKNQVHLVSVKGGKGYSYATPKHLSIADSTGDSAIIEIQKGEVKIFHGREYRILTNPPSYQEQLENAKKYQNATEAELPNTGSGKDRFVRADFWVRNLPQPRNNDANTAYGFMYSVLGNVAFPAGSSVPEEDKEVVQNITKNLRHPEDSYGSLTYFQSISDLTNKHYRFKSLIAPSDVFFDLAEYDFQAGQTVKVVKRIDQYSLQGWSGNIIPHLVAIEGDIYDEPVE